MTAQGRMTTSAIRQLTSKGEPVQVLLTTDPAGKAAPDPDAGRDTVWYGSNNLRGITATVLDVETVPATGYDRQVRFKLVTDKGTTFPATGAQTWKLAPAHATPPATPAPTPQAAPADTNPAVLEALANLSQRIPAGEDVHRGNVARLAAAYIEGTLTGHEVRQRLAAMGAPLAFRHHIDRAASEIAAAIGIEPVPFRLAVPYVKAGDVVTLPGETERVTVRSYGWLSEQQSHLLVLEAPEGQEPRRVKFLSANLDDVELHTRPGFGPWDVAYQIGDRVHVYLPINGKTEIGKVIGMEVVPLDATGDQVSTVYEIQTVIAGKVAAAVDRMTRDTDPNPAVGQMWVNRDGVHARVTYVWNETHPCGQVASLETADGRKFQSVVLARPYWQHVTELDFSGGNPAYHVTADTTPAAAEPAPAVADDVWADLAAFAGI